MFNKFKDYLGESSDVFSAIGAVTTGIIAFKVAIGIFRFISTYILARALGLAADLKKAGSWAVITGSTDGIGKAYAEQLAARGLNVVLISRTLSKLTELARDIENKYKVKTHVIAADFTQEDIYDNIRTELLNLDIGVLVNNVGVSYEYPEYFDKVNTPDFVTNMIHMNCTSVAKMSQIVLPGMVLRSRGYIINIGSSSSTNSAPLLSLYSGTKAFVDVFSTALSYEYSSKGITVQCVRPYFVVSKLSKFRRPTLFVPSPTTFVKSALNTVGILNSTTGFWAHAIQDLYMQFIPMSVAKYFLEQAREKALKRKAASLKTQ